MFRKGFEKTVCLFYGRGCPMDSPVVTRFAPSPTGRLHLGHALAAWEARSLADRFDGRCVLRMEDIDRTRCREEFVTGILEDLTWLGIRFDGVVMVQSERLACYEQALQQLRNLGVLYPCFCTRKEIAEEVAAMGGAPQGGCVDVYPGTCRQLDQSRRQELMASGKPFSWRLDCRAAARITGALRWRDLRFGDQVCHPEELGDVILGRKDCAASYHIAVVTDDAAQGVTHVSRGEDLFPVTGIHRTLQALLGLPVPLWYHHRLVKDASGKRLAKRDKSMSLQEMRSAGATPQDIFRLMRGK